MKLLALKIFMTVMLPFVLIYTIVSRIWAEIRFIPGYVRCDVAEDLRDWIGTITMDEHDLAAYERELEIRRKNQNG